MKPVSVSLQDLVNETIPFDTLTEAFGPASLGIIIVRDLPAEFKVLRKQVLSNASYLAALPEAELESLTSPQSSYLTGWSRGKETLRSGHFDLLKGSFYINCAFYQDPTLQGGPRSISKDGGDSDPLVVDSYTAHNIWPSETQLPGFRKSAEQLCSLIIDMAVLVARACDQFVVQDSGIEGYVPGYLERVVRGSFTTKARLLHYFPSSVSPDAATVANGQDQTRQEELLDDDWCGIHVDHGCLTGLTSAMFVDEAASTPSLGKGRGEPLAELDESPDPAAGLYIRSRTGQAVKITIPKDCLAFQAGEALELITRGKFRAVPHFVRGVRATGNAYIARNTLAVFTQPNLDEEVQPGRSFGDFARDVIRRTY